MVKRLFDLALTLPGFVALSPLLALVALTVRVKHGAPILFRQTRPGLHGKPFPMYKFRTMTDVRDSRGNLLPDEMRLTSFGRFLRSTSLDELPEFFNVLRGEMSLVGPRPLLMQYLDRYTPEQARRHEVKPGITGLAQIKGRNAITWEEKFALDVWYVDNRSLWLDLKVLFLTIFKVFRREGVSHCHGAPGAHLAGGVLLAEGVLVGVGASLLPGVIVGAWSVVGAGAVVLENVPSETVVAGGRGRG